MATEKQTKPVVDDEYKEAIQPVVDDRMRTDILGPHFCKVLKDHKPASEDIVSLITGAVENNKQLKDALKTVIDERNNETKMKWFQRGLGVIGTILLGLLIWAIQQLISGNFNK